MEMIDVLQKLKEIQESQPGLVDDAVANVEKTNPKVDEGALKQAMHGDAENMSREEFVKKYGQGSGEFWDNINGVEESKEEIKKETVKESIQMSADTPEEANVLMQILKLAGVQPVTPNMIGAQEPEKDHMCGPECAEHGCGCENDNEEPTEENFANEPNEKVQDTDTLVNFHSGGLNRQKKTFPKVAGGDNPMQKATEDLVSSLREQYKNFKESYQNEAKKGK